MIRTDLSTCPRDSVIEPEAELILAVYRRARNDLLYAGELWREDAEAFFWADGFDPEEIRAAWQGRRGPGGRWKGVQVKRR